MKLALALLAVISLGCSTHLGTGTWPDTTTTTTAPDGSVTVEKTEGGASKGVLVTVGQQDTPITNGAAISVPGAGLIGGIFEAAASAVGAFFGTTNINVLPAGAPAE